MQSPAKKIVDSVVRQLHEKRLEEGLSHEKLANLSGLSRSAISFIEARKREATLMTLLKISLALKCNLGDLLLEAAKELKK